MGEGGMGTVLPKKGAFLHGVLHVVTAKEMEILDIMEGGYNHVDVVVNLYDGTTRPAIAYMFKPERISKRTLGRAATTSLHPIHPALCVCYLELMTKHNPPSERYLVRSPPL